ncbi:MAG TPA: sensor histidine kinase [Bacilli bacterium]
MKLKRYRDWHIKTKLLLITALIISSLLFLESILSYTQYTRNFEAESSDHVQQIIEQASLNIDNYLDDLIRLAKSPYRNDAVMRALEEEKLPSEAEQLEQRWTIENFLDEMMILPRNDILQVNIFTNEIYSISRISTFDYTQTEYKETDWYRKALSSRDPVFIPARLQRVGTGGKLPIFSLALQLRSTRNTERILGVIKVDANYRGIEEILNKIDMGKEGGLLLTDDRNSTIYSSLKGTQIEPFLAAAGASISNGGQTTIAGKGYLLNSVSIPRVGWKLVAVNSLDELNQKSRLTRNITLVIALVCSLFAILVLSIFIRNFLKPLFAIVRLMKEINHGNLSVRFTERRSDEIGYLGSSFNGLVIKVSDMLERNTSLIKEVYEARLLQQEAQFKALHNQIRPHFIFNTLNMISLLMQSGKQEQAIDHIHKLSSILRSITTWDREVTLRQEIGLLTNYISIQSSRYEGRLACLIDIDEQWYDMPIPPLLFQPIVENAVIHGCEAKREKTTIRIASLVDHNDLMFQISDDGGGMNAETLRNLRQKIAEPLDSPAGIANGSADLQKRFSGMGVGLINVHQRIRLRYGERYGLKIESEPGAGTTVTIRLPLPDGKRQTGKKEDHL